MAAKRTNRRWTESDVFARLHHVFPEGAYALLPQVRNGTGFTRKKDSTADAIAVSCWPSRGLFLAGVEIKVSRSDWKKELASPEKSTHIQKYCRNWWVATPKGIVEPGELPPNWGQIVVHENRAKIEAGAAELEPEPLDLPLMCSILRAAIKSFSGFVSQNDVNRMVDERVQSELERHTRVLENRIKKDSKSREAFEKASGVTIGHWEAGRIGDAVKFVMDNGVHGMKRVAEDLQRKSQAIADKAAEFLASCEGKE